MKLSDLIEDLQQELRQIAEQDEIPARSRKFPDYAPATTKKSDSAANILKPKNNIHVPMGAAWRHRDVPFEAAKRGVQDQPRSVLAQHTARDPVKAKGAAPKSRGLAGILGRRQTAR